MINPNAEGVWRELERTWRAAGGAPVVACVLGDFIDAAAAAGDPVAIQMLQRMRPRDVPPAVAKFYRNRDFHKLTAYIRNRLPAISRHRVAVLIDALGRPLGVSPPRSLARDFFLKQKMPPEEIAALATWIEKEIRWITPTDWSLGVRQITSIIRLQF